jgi:hypothetical protein
VFLCGGLRWVLGVGIEGGRLPAEVCKEQVHVGLENIIACLWIDVRLW